MALARLNLRALFTTILAGAAAAVACGSSDDGSSSSSGSSSGQTQCKPTTQKGGISFATLGCRGADDGGATDAGDASSDASSDAASDAGSKCECATACASFFNQGGCSAVTDAGFECVFTQPCLGGRRPDGLVDLHSSDWLLRSAHLEAASVVAFERLASEIDRLRGPSDLVARLCACAEDEVRHAEAMLGLAGGAALPVVRVEDVGTRDAFTIALENAREGCVRETFAALVAEWQAIHAKDAAVRATMKAVAEDETRHAELSWELDDFLAQRLDAEQREAVADARRVAVTRLREELARGGIAADERLGLPDAATAVALLDALDLAA